MPLIADADRMQAIGRAALDVLLAVPDADPGRLATLGYGARVAGGARPARRDHRDFVRYGLSELTAPSHDRVGRIPDLSQSPPLANPVTSTHRRFRSPASTRATRLGPNGRPWQTGQSRP